MKGKTKNQPRKGGKFAQKATPPKVMLGFCATPSTVAAVEQLADEFFNGVKSTAMDFLTCFAMQEIGRPVEGVVVPRIPGLNAPEAASTTVRADNASNSPITVGHSNTVRVDVAVTEKPPKRRRK